MMVACAVAAAAAAKGAFVSDAGQLRMMFGLGHCLPDVDVAAERRRSGEV